MRRVLSGLLVCGCYSGVEAAALDGAELPEASSGGSDDGAPSEPDDEDEPPEIGDCDPDAIGSSTLRRLNRREYRNTVEDLFGVVPDVALPWDNLNSVGFDNDGGALTLDVAAASQYYDAAETIAAEVRGTARAPLHECAEQDDLHATSPRRARQLAFASALLAVGIGVGVTVGPTLVRSDSETTTSPDPRAPEEQPPPPEESTREPAVPPQTPERAASVATPTDATQPEAQPSTREVEGTSRARVKKRRRATAKRTDAPRLNKTLLPPSQQ